MEQLSKIKSFLKYPPAESDSECKKLDKLNELAKSIGYQQAIKAVIEDPSYVTNDLRLKIFDLFELNKNCDVLEIGASLGQMTVEICKRSKFVSAVEVVPGQAEFVLERCNQEKCSNVEVVCAGDDCQLPYESSSFDRVVMNLVFEWCANRVESIPFEEGQMKLLKECYRVLRPGGKLFISTKNRFALSRLLGQKDEHTYGMIFGNTLPRALMYFILKLKGRSRPMGLLHSFNYFNKMIERSGFNKLHQYWLIPEMRYPELFVECSTESINKARREIKKEHNGRIIGKLMKLIPSRYLKHFTPGLCTVATKNID